MPVQRVSEGSRSHVIINPLSCKGLFFKLGVVDILIQHVEHHLNAVVELWFCFQASQKWLRLKRRPVLSMQLFPVVGEILLFECGQTDLRWICRPLQSRASLICWRRLHLPAALYKPVGIAQLGD